MVAYSRYTPDPDIEDEEGYGWFEDDEGNRRYAYDPEEARRLREAAEARAQAERERMTAMATPDAIPPYTVDQLPEASDAAQPVPGMGRQPPPTNDAMEIAPPETGDALSIAIPESSRIAYVHNNPGNLMYAGQEGATRGEEKKGGGNWAKFETPEDGYNALKRQIALDANRGHTLGSFIGKYAPEFENNVSAYTRNVESFTGATADTPLKDLDADELAQAMARQESSTKVRGSAAQMPGQPRQRPAAPIPPGAGGMAPGLVPAQQTVRGVPLTPEQIEGEQRRIYDQTMQQAAMNQAATQGVIAGRQQENQRQQEAHDAFLRDNAMRVITAQRAAEDARQKLEREFAQPVQKLDPKRYIKNMSTGDRVLGWVAMLVSGIGRAIAAHGGLNSPNLAMQHLDKAIQDDIEAQRDEIARGQRDKESRVAHYTRVMGNEEQGVKLAMAEGYAAAAKRIEQHAHMSDLNEQARAQMMTYNAELIAKGQALASQVQQQETERLTTIYAPPKPVAPPSPEDAWKQAEAASKLQELQQTGRRPEQNVELRKDTEELGAKLDDVSSIRAGLDRVYSAAGLKRDDATGELRMVRKDIPGRGAWDAAVGAMAEWPAWTGLGMAGQAIEGATGARQERKALDVSLDNLVDLLVRERTGAAVTKAEADRFKDILASGWRESDFLTKLETFDAFLRQREKDIRSAAQTDALSEYERRRRALGGTQAGGRRVRGLSSEP